MKFMNKIRKVAVVLPMICLGLLSSCSEWLTLEPEDGVISDNYWTTKEEVYSSVIGCYSSMLTQGVAMRMFMWGELRGDCLTPNSITSDAQAIMDGEIVATNKYCTWSFFYTTINQCNTVIDKAPGAQETDDSFTDEMLEQYQAEAKAIRGLMYFYLVRTFRDVPYITQAIVSDDQDLQVAKTSGSTILDSVAIDLEDAVKHVSSNYGTDVAVNKGRFSAYGIYALLADIYLWQQNYSNCISCCNKVINSGQTSLLLADNSHLYEEIVDNALTGELDTIYNVTESVVDEMFNQMYVNGNCDESIFELQRESDLLNYDYWYMFYSPGYFYANTTVLGEQYFLDSQVSSSWYDIRSAGISYKGNYLWKQMGTARTGTVISNMRALDNMVGNIIIYRLSEVYLMKAEALVQQAKVYEGTDDTKMASLLAEAWDLVKVIRKRANATETTDLCADISSTTELTCSTMESFVYQEEVRELMFEGKRWFTALRHAKRNDYEGSNLEYLTNIAVYGASASKVTSLQTKLKNKDFHYLPISQTELDANKLLVQNPYYQ
jgi:starch-binding outer membrane protein, SusD/RagB family